MSVLYVTLPIALMLGAIGLIACLFCIKSGQYDDLDTPSLRILHDDLPVRGGVGEFIQHNAEPKKLNQENQD